MSDMKILVLEDGSTYAVGTPAPRRGRYRRLAPGQCSECDDPTNPVSHFASGGCRSFGMGAVIEGRVGTRAHCTCDACF